MDRPPVAPFSARTRVPEPLPGIASLEYRQLHDVGPVIWMVLSSSAVIMDINAFGAQVLGAPRTFVIGTPLRMWSTGESRVQLLEHVWRCRTSDEVVETELQLKRRHGEPWIVRLHTRRAWLHDRLVFPSVAIDVSEQRSSELARQRAERERDRAETERRAARAAEAAKDRLIATVSHELRNPLSPALIAASSLEMWPGLPERARDMAATIKRNIQLEARLIDDLLDLARATRGQFDLRMEPVDVHQILLQAVDDCSAAAAAKHVTVVLDTRAEQHDVLGDATRLEQVFWNLFNNAIKFSDRGGQVVICTDNDPAGMLTTTVRDFGAGMDADTVDKLFTPFEQPGVPSEGRAGLGLGLTIVRGIIEQHGGRIWAASDGRGRGAQFEVELSPIDASQRLAGEAASGPSAEITPSADGARVLIVEDHEDTAQLLATFLQQQGYEVTVTNTLRQGLAAVGAEWDAIVSDIGLGDGSGLEIARRVTANGDRPRHVIALSGFGTNKDIEASREAGFDHHLVKPVDLVRLLQLLAL